MPRKKTSRRSKTAQRGSRNSEQKTWAALDMAIADQNQAGRTDQARTVIYVHGIGNKPTPSILRCQWDGALFGQRMGDRTRMAYWVNRQRHGGFVDAECAEPDLMAGESEGGIQAASIGAEPLSDDKVIERLASNKQGRDWLKRVNESLAEGEEAGVSAAFLDNIFGAPMNWFFRLTRRLFLADVYDFFFDEEARERMLQSVREKIETGGGPFVVIAHSQGSMIAYHYLRGLSRAECHVPLFVTIGSPLGLPPVRDRFQDWIGRSKLPFPDCVDRWINVANRGDIVAKDRDLDNDIDGRTRTVGQSFENEIVDSPNPDLRRDRHSATGYLKTDGVDHEVRQAVGQDFAQPVAMQVVANDLVEDVEQVPRSVRRPVLIELRIDPSDPTRPTTDEIREKIANRITEMAQDEGGEPRIDHTKRFISAELTQSELERLRTDYTHLKIHRIWRDMDKRALINTSRITIQAAPANLAYEAEGQGVTWAILDTGLDLGHAHFAKHGNAAQLWDCTGLGVQKVESVTDELDPNGHGTHAAGIVAGDWQNEQGQRFAGMAPRARLYGFKVLANNGNGRDSYIIKALDKIADINDAAGRLEIHGVNLSLGGNFDPRVYGCGHTPLCNELRRLWRQGVIVVIAAGNEGYEILRKASGGDRSTNLDLSIGDPANLEEAIAVGSVHRSRPHTYGVSFFSSRGPTADGRCKPDLVAPGEKIVSARAGARNGMNDGLYVEASGTSMAAPHVSGVLAAFLSIRREFIGYPDRLKELLLRHCTDLGRDGYLQGQGMPNLIQMLSET